MSTAFSDKAKADSCAFCFDVLINHFDAKAPIRKPAIPKGKFPLFVTWKKSSGREEWRLRGCIGTFGARPLEAGLREYALISSLKDSRFNPMVAREIPSLAVNTSFLTDFEDAKDCYDWTIGKHGISIRFRAAGASYTATYLPEVCKEQGWDKPECLDSLIRKAGFRGRVDESFRRGVSVERYQSVKASMTYKEYLEYSKTSAADTTPKG